jgi:hypothetical protein
VPANPSTIPLLASVSSHMERNMRANRGAVCYSMPWFFVMLSQRHVQRVFAVRHSHVGSSMLYHKVFDTFQPSTTSKIIVILHQISA